MGFQDGILYILVLLCALDKTGTIPVTHSVALMPQSLQEGFLGGDSYKIKDVKRLGLTYEDPECVKRCQRSQDGLA